MRWIRRNIHVDRTSCPWPIRKFIDEHAEFIFVDKDAEVAGLKGHTFDMRGAEYGHEGDQCTFQVMLERHGLCGDAALVEMGRIIHAGRATQSNTPPASPRPGRAHPRVPVVSPR